MNKKSVSIKKMAVKFGLIIGIIFTVSCLGKQTNPPSTLTVGVESFAENLDPRYPTEALASKISKLIMPGLLIFNDKLELVPDLAQTIDSKNPTHIVVTLKDNVFFHNGQKLTSHDVMASYDSLKTTAKDSPLAGLFDQLDHMEAKDDLSIHFYLKQPFAPFLTYLTMGLLPKELASSQFKPIGCGPYQFDASVPREKIILKRNENYFGDKAKSEHLVFRTITDDTLRTLELIKGRLDLVQNAIPTLLLRAIKKESALQIVSAPGINVTYLGFNLKNKTLSDVNVRRAIGLAINKDELIKTKLEGLGSPASSILSPDNWAFDSSIKMAGFNPDQAKNILDPLTKEKLIYKTSNKKDRIDMALLISDALKNVGLQAQVQSYEWGTFFRDVRTGNFDLFTLTFVGITEPDIYYTAFHSTQTPPTGLNRFFYSNPQIDKLTETGRTTTDKNARIKIYTQIQQILAQDLPIIPLWYEHNVVVMNKQVKGFTPRSDASFSSLVSTYKE